MPRKLDGMNFEIHPSPMKDSEGRNLLYVRPLQGQHITLSELDEHCCEHAGLPRNTLTSVFNYFLTACAEFLADGQRIKTPMGVFSPRLSLKRQITDPADVHVEDVEWNGVEFQPSQRFMDEIMRWSRGFKHVPFYDKNAKAPTEAQLQQALERSIADIGGHTTVSSFRFFAGLTRHSAQKYLDSLCAGDHPQLARRLVGRTFIYEKCGQ